MQLSGGPVLTARPTPRAPFCEGHSPGYKLVTWVSRPSIPIPDFCCVANEIRSKDLPDYSFDSWRHLRLVSSVIVSVCNAINVYNLTCNNCSENCTDVLFSNKITFLMDLLIHQLTQQRPGTGIHHIAFLVRRSQNVEFVVTYVGAEILQLFKGRGEKMEEAKWKKRVGPRKRRRQGQSRAKEGGRMEKRPLVYVPDENNAILGRNTNKQVFEGLTTGLLKVSAVVFGCLIANRPDGNSRPTTPKISTQEMKNKPSQGKFIPTLTSEFFSPYESGSSYVVNIGLVDKLCGCFLSVQGPVDDSPRMAAFLQHAAGLLHGMCTLCFAVTGSDYEKTEDGEVRSVLPERRSWTTARHLQEGLGPCAVLGRLELLHLCSSVPFLPFTFVVPGLS
ncbi:hypothetical protein CB1_000113016 [Camelus ferus]|nr:hypothetical protein CB1_000113016 [Camelus ferus]